MFTQPVGDVRHVLFWVDTALCQFLAIGWGLIGLLLWGETHPISQGTQICLLLACICFCNGVFYVAKGLGWVAKLRRQAPNPLIWPVIHIFAASFLLLSVLLTLFSTPSFLFVLGLAITVMVTPYITAAITAITLRYVFGYDLVELTLKIQANV